VQKPQCGVQIAEESHLNSSVADLRLQKGVDTPGITVPEISPVLAHEEYRLRKPAGAKLACELQVMFEVNRILDVTIVRRAVLVHDPLQRAIEKSIVQVKLGRLVQQIE
jgi:hypothetical protein